ncbi:LysR family transcriptional regulator [Pseudomonas fontis]|uniref:LysR family transcriptional regulator n=1 Tax=Pseudomonas fontis TaxID=2942633 RepID=A0ABT5NNU9_9PSED|nr:LysR family transcriptional regulator [Pseudomonas fontis]MDD0973060.1 LysR family transcriptional regulator [Pseudomonas fontis]MDD0989829.1 LysR family transcriptional regulator [Pseudomonas fontis]
MQFPDMNLLVALDALLDEGSVVGAARRMNLSPAAMSRTLTRIRQAVGDPILVRAGRGLVPTPKAIALRSQVRQVVEQANQLFTANDDLDLTTLERTFNVRANDVFITPYCPPLFEAMRQQAPRTVLRLMPEAEDDEDDALRDGRLDLYVGATRDLGPEIKVQGLFSTSFVCLARNDHPIFDDEITPERFASFEQISVSRRGRARGPIDDALAAQALQRRVALITPSVHCAMFALLDGSLLLPLPEHMQSCVARLGLPLRSFRIPFALEPVKVMQAWHARVDNDPAHRWLRQILKACCSRHQI